MADKDEVYFPMTGEENHAFMLVRLFSEGGSIRAEPSLRGPLAEGADYDYPPAEGEPSQILRAVREFAGLRGLDIRIQRDGVEWDPELGTLVE